MYAYSDSQFMFDRALAGLFTALKIGWKIFLYLPLWFTAYIICEQFLQKEAGAFAWLGLILFFSIFLYQLIFFVKGLIIGVMDSGKLIGLPLLIICLFFTCFLPVYLIFPDIYKVMLNIYAPQAKLLTWFASIGLFAMIYSRYHFLTDMAPLAAYPSYQAGLSLSSSMIGQQSKRIF